MVKLSTAFHKYAYESVRPEEAWKAVSKGEAVVDSPEEYVAILMKHSTKDVSTTMVYIHVLNP
jgi:hypothetical protein